MCHTCDQSIMTSRKASSAVYTILSQQTVKDSARKAYHVACLTNKLIATVQLDLWPLEMESHQYMLRTKRPD